MIGGRRSTRSDQHGQTSVLIIGFAVIILLMIAVVVDSSAAYLRRQGLDSLADGAALAAADGVEGERVYQQGLDQRAQIDPAVAQMYAEQYLSSVGARGKYPGFSYSLAVTTDSVIVRVSAPLELTFSPPGWEQRSLVSATAASFVAVSE